MTQEQVEKIGQHVGQLLKSVFKLGTGKECTPEEMHQHVTCRGKTHCHIMILVPFKDVESLYKVLDVFLCVSNYKWRAVLTHSSYPEQDVQLEFEQETWPPADIIRELDYKNCLAKQALDL